MSSKQFDTKVSVIIPTYNEENHIKCCLESVFAQSYHNLEIIVVDDGSQDNSVNIASQFKKKHQEFRLFRQPHRGPGETRNFGARKALGEIFVFIDADMILPTKFVTNLVSPIIRERCVGTAPGLEILANPTNYWAKCWNIGRYFATGQFSADPLVNLSPNTEDSGGVFRAIKRRNFIGIGGFEKGGDYTDDETLSEKLGIRAMTVKNALIYHSNPDRLSEVWMRASWIGNGKRFTGSLSRKIISLVKFSFPISLLKAVIIAIKFKTPEFVPFKVIYDAAIFLGVVKSFL